MKASSIFLLCAGILAPLFPGTAQCDDNLLTLYREAVRNSANYLAAQAFAQAEMENEQIALGQLLPSVGLAGNYGRNTTERTVGNLPSENFRYESYSYSLNLRQPLFRKYNVANYRQGQADAEAATAKLSQAGNDLIVKLGTAYFEVLYSDNQLALLAAQKAAIATQAAAAERSLKAGSGTRIDVDEANARYDFVRAQEFELENMRRHNLRVLSSFVNRPVENIQPLDTGNFRPSAPMPAEVDQWLIRAEANNAEYQFQLAQIKIAEQEVEKALAGHYPTLDLVASAGRSANDNLSNLNNRGDTTYNTSNYGVQLNIPLFAGGQVNATTRQARAKLEQARMTAEDTRRNLHVQTRREFDNVIQGIGRIRALEQAEISAIQVVKSNEKGIQASVRSTIDLLLAQQQLFVTRRDLAQARYGVLLANLRLQGLSGNLGEDEIVAIDRQLLSGKR